MTWKACMIGCLLWGNLGWVCCLFERRLTFWCWIRSIWSSWFRRVCCGWVLYVRRGLDFVPATVRTFILGLIFCYRQARCCPFLLLSIVIDVLWWSKISKIIISRILSRFCCVIRCVLLSRSWNMFNAGYLYWISSSFCELCHFVASVWILWISYSVFLNII